MGYFFVFLIGKKIRGVLNFVATMDGLVGTAVVGFSKYASYCGLISWIKGIPQNEIHENLYTSKISTRTVVYHKIICKKL